MDRLSKQHGMTTVGLLLTVVMAGIILLLSARILPMYMDFYNARSVLNSFQNEPETANMAIPQLSQLIKRRFNISYVDRATLKDITVRDTRSKRIIQLRYQDQRSLVANLSVLADFDYRVELHR